jgi:hypothetical protein
VSWLAAELGSTWWLDLLLALVVGFALALWIASTQDTQLQTYRCTARCAMQARSITTPPEAPK